MEITCEEICEYAESFFRLEPGSIASRSRRVDVATARRSALYLMHLLTDTTLAEMGSVVGRDHASVMFDLEKAKSEMQTDGLYRQRLASLRRFIEEAKASTPKERFSFGRLTEHDIDTFLMYSFVSDADFIKLFTNKLDLHLLRPRLIDIELSAENTDGEEPCLMVRFGSGDVSYALFIESRVDAPIRAGQHERSLVRGQLGIKNEDYEAFFLVLCAPKSYIDRNDEASKYENTISFEEIEEYLYCKNSAFDQLRLSEVQQAIAASKKPSGC